MEDYKKLMEEIDRQEKELVFDSFTYDEAFELGSLFYEEAKKQNLPIVIDIVRNTQQLFHAALPGSSADNDQWIIRKNRVVTRFGRSSFYIRNKLAASCRTIEESFHLSEFEYAPNGGAFPLTIRNVGVVGTITVSGLAQEDDHAFVVSTIRKFLESRNG